MSQSRTPSSYLMTGLITIKLVEKSILIKSPCNDMNEGDELVLARSFLYVRL
jgi:hypothetical protein